MKIDSEKERNLHLSDPCPENQLTIGREEEGEEEEKKRGINTLGIEA